MSQDSPWPDRPDPSIPEAPSPGWGAPRPPPPGFPPARPGPPRRPDYGYPPQPAAADPRTYPGFGPTPANRPQMSSGYDAQGFATWQDRPASSWSQAPAGYGDPQGAPPARSSERAVWPDDQPGASPDRPSSPRRGRPPIWQAPAAEPSVAAARPAYHRQRSRGWSLPIEHIVLAAGIASLAFSLAQPWGLDAQGQAIAMTPLARQIATYTIGTSAVLGGLLMLLNKRMGCLAMVGCLTLFLIPLVVAAGIGGVQVFTQLHVIPPLTPEHINATNRGFYLWWGGIAITLIGLALQVITHRRKGIIGI